MTISFINLNIWFYVAASSRRDANRLVLDSSRLTLRSKLRLANWFSFSIAAFFKLSTFSVSGSDTRQFQCSSFIKCFYFLSARLRLCVENDPEPNGYRAEIPHLQRKEAAISKQEQSGRLLTEEEPTRPSWAMDGVQVSFVFLPFCLVLLFLH